MSKIKNRKCSLQIYQGLLHFWTKRVTYSIILISHKNLDIHVLARKYYEYIQKTSIFACFFKTR